MTSNRPYLIRALYDWITDNNLTPYLLIDAKHESAHVPGEFVEDGRIVLNISDTAVRGLSLGNSEINFSARFGGASVDIALSPDAVLGIYARENGNGMLFPEAEGGESGGGEDPDPAGPGGPGRPSLKVVK